MEHYESFLQNGAGTRCISGLTAMDEKLVQGRYVLRYLNACGQVVPEMHLPDSLFCGEDETVFSLKVRGEVICSGWRVGEIRREEESVSVCLMHDTCPIEVTVITRADGTGWFSRELNLKNTGVGVLPLDEVAPLCGRIWRHRFESGILSYRPEEGGVMPDGLYEAGYSERCVWGQEGDFAFHPLGEDGLTYDGGMNGRSGWSRPAFVLKNNLNGQLFCCEFAYSGNWRMKLCPSLKIEEASLRYEIAIAAPQDECVRVLAPGEEVRTPAIHFTLRADGFRNLVHARHRFVREQVMPRRDPIGPCRIEANHRGYLCNRENEEGIKRDMTVAAAAGVELYVIDAGWYGKDPNVWFDNAGDWHAGSWLPNDLYPLAEHARKLGMKVGLWMEIEAAGANSDLRRDHPEFLLKRHGNPCAGGRALDFSNPEVVCWVEEQIVQVISRYRLDMFRIDHNHYLMEGGTRESEGYTENLTWRYIDNLYAMFRRLRERFPQVSFQNCAAGGGRLDLGILRFFDHTEISDWARPPRELRIFNGILSQLPPEIQLRICGTEVCEHVQDSDMLSQLHSIMQGRMIFRGIAPSPEELAPPLLELIRKETRLYKEELRPILTSGCLVYLHEKQQGIMQAAPWSANEFAAPDRSRAFAVVHKLAASEENHYRLRFSGLSVGRKYCVYCDRRNDSFEAGGRELMDTGLLLEMDHCLDSELVLAKELPAPNSGEKQKEPF